jgi:hypothetical protein
MEGFGVFFIIIIPACVFFIFIMTREAGDDSDDE